MKFTPRTIVLISVGILAYIALAAYYSNVKKNNPLPEQQALMSHEQSEAAQLQHRDTSSKQEITAARKEETKLRKELSGQSKLKDTLSAEQKHLKQMRQELADRELQLNKLRQGRDVIAKGFQEMQEKLAHSEATAAGLNKSNQELADELSKSQATIKQLEESDYLFYEYRTRHSKTAGYYVFKRTQVEAIAREISEIPFTEIISSPVGAFSSLKSASSRLV